MRDVVFPVVVVAFFAAAAAYLRACAAIIGRETSTNAAPAIDEGNDEEVAL